MHTVYDLMHAVCERLSGKKIRLRMTDPGDSLDGVTWRDETGRLRVDIKPYLDDERLLYVLCHEIAHTKHHRYLKASESYVRSYHYDKTTSTHKVKEDQADRQAKIWSDYALAHRDHSLPLLEGSLWSLLSYKDGDT